MIVNAWSSMLDKRDGDGEAFGQVSREMYTIMRGVHAHTGKHHVGGKMPDCVEYRNVVEGWNACDREMEAQGGKKGVAARKGKKSG